MRRVLVTGGNGAVGPHVVEAFANTGWQVSTLSRTRAVAGTLPATCDEFVGDLFDDDRLAEAVAGVEVVVHLAGLLHIVEAQESLAAEYLRVNAEGTSRVMAAARGAGVKRVVLASTISVYGPTHGRIVDEAAAPCPDSLYASSKLASERALLAEKHPDGTPCGVVLRLAAVYGGRVKGNYERLVRALDRGRFIPIGRGENHRTLVHEQDAASAFVLAAEHPDAPGRILNVTDGKAHTVAAITDAICKALGRRSPGWALPAGVAQGAAIAAEIVFAVLRRRPPLSRRTLAKYLENVEVSGEAFMRDLGFSPQRDLEPGWRSAIREMKRLGRI